MVVFVVVQLVLLLSEVHMASSDSLEGLGESAEAKSSTREALGAPGGREGD